MSTITTLSTTSQLAQAAYSSFASGDSSGSLIGALTAGAATFSATQATLFAEQYSVLLQYNDDTPGAGGNGTSLSVTVFKDVTTNALTLAIRGTLETEDFVPTDGNVAARGAGYDQIAALYNWWLRASTPAGQPVTQFRVREVEFDGTSPTATLLPLYGLPNMGSNRVMALETIAPVVATGELVGALSADGDHKLDVTGHSLGGHLSMAFAALFPTATASVTAFNAPGFTATPINEQFFTRLGGTVPTSASIGGITTNVIADHTTEGTVPWQGIAALHSRPGSAIDIAIENQWQSSESNKPAALNHSQMVLADALAVHALFERLQPGLTTSAMNAMLREAANREHAGLEGLVGALRATLGLSSTTLPAGHGEREAMYQAIAAITGSATYQSLAGKITIRSASALELSTLGQTDFAAVASLLTLGPIVLQGNGDEGKSALESLWQSAAWTSAYQNWLGDFALRQAGQDAVHYTQSWLEDRGLLLATIARRNANDSTNPIVGDNSLSIDRVIDMRYLEPGSGAAQTLSAWNPSNNPLGNALTARPHQLVVFGGETDESIDGLEEARLGDHLYGGNGNDLLNGLAGADRLEGNSGNDILDGGNGNDTLLGGKDSDTYRFASAFGHDRVIDSDGAGHIEVEGLGTLNGTGARKVAETQWADANGSTYYSLVEIDAGRTDLIVSFGDRPGTITIQDWSTDRNVGIDLPTTITPPETTAAFAGDIAKASLGNDYQITDYGYASAGAAPDAADVLNGGAGADLLQGLGGSDGIAGGAGDDMIEGGDGDDLLLGGSGADTIDGGAGNDHIFGSDNGRIDRPTKVDFTPPGSSGTELARGFSWVVYDPPGDGNHFVAGAGDISPNGESDGNVIDGGAGDDSIGAGSGDDVAQGGEGADVIVGMGGSDVLLGDAGADELWGDGFQSGAGWNTALADHGHDLLVGGSGNDDLIGQGGDDTLYGGADDDLLQGDGDVEHTPAAVHGDDVLDGGDGNDELSGGGRNDILTGGNGDDSLWGDASLDNLAGAHHGEDLLDGGVGNDYLEGGGHIDVLYGGEGNDTLWGDASSAGLSSAEFGADYLAGDAGDDVLVGGGAADALLGGDGDDYLLGDDGITASADHGADLLDGGAGNDTLSGGGGNDVLIGGAGADALLGGDGDDEYRIGRDEGGAGAYRDTLYDTSGLDTLALEGMDLDALQVGVGADGMLEIAWAAGQGVLIDRGLTASVGTVIASGQSIGLAQLVGERLATTQHLESARVGGVMMGGAAGDSLTVAHEGNTVSAGRGDDTIDIQSDGGVTVAMSTGDGFDAVTAVRRSASGEPAPPRNVLRLGEGVTANDLRLYKTGSTSYALVFNDAGDGVRFSASTPGSQTVDPADWPFDAVQFADGASLSWQSVLDRGIAASPAPATEGDDTLLLTPIADTVFGLGGNDHLEGLGGNDSLYGNAGDDYLDGGAGHDLLDGGAGTNTLVGGDGDDTLVGGYGETGFNTVRGGEGNDKYLFYTGIGIGAGGLAEDSSSSSDDTYTVRSGGAGSGYALTQNWTLRDHGGSDEFFFDSDLIPSNLSVLRSGSDLLVKQGLMTVKIEGAITEDGTLDPSRGIESLRFRTGETFNAAQLIAMTLQGSAGNDVITGYRGDDSIDGGTGNDTLNGNAGNDALHGASGDDRLQGDEGNDSLSGDEGNDLLFGDAGDDVLSGGAGVDTLYGGDGADTFEAGPDGGDLYGGDGDDHYFVRDGDGSVRVGGSRGYEDEGTDSLTIDTAPSVVSVTVEASTLGGSEEDDLVIRWNSGTVVARLLLEGDRNGPSGGVESIRFADGSAVDWAQLAASVTPAATAGADTLTLSSLDDDVLAGAGDDEVHGRAGNDNLAGEDGSDALFGGSGDDLLDGGAGDDQLDGGGSGGSDVLTGGIGDDTITGVDSRDTVRYAAGDGHDTLHGTPWIELASGVSASDVTLRRTSGDGLTVSVGVSGSILSESVYSESDVIAGVRFSDGTTWTQSDVTSRLFAGTDQDDTIIGFSSGSTMSSGAGNDTLHGMAGFDVLDGGNGNDELHGSAGDDILVGGAGADVLYAGNGSDLLVAGDGDDTLDSASETDSLASPADHDTLIGGTGNDVLIASRSGAMTYRFDAGFGSDRVQVGWYRNAGLSGIARFGAGLSPDQAHVSRAYGDLILSFPSSSDTVRVVGFFQTGSSTAVSAESPVTQVEFADGTVWDAAQLASRVAPALTATDDVYVGSASVDVIDALAGNDHVFAGAGNDVVHGGSGNDWLMGEDGDDVIDGGTGDDGLEGGSGNDRYEYQSGDGDDWIYDEAGNADALALGAGITTADVSVTLQDAESEDSYYWIELGSTGDRISLSTSEIESVVFADGTVWNAQTLDRMARTIHGTEANDTLIGTANDDSLLGLGGDDDLTGNAGQDLLDGGTGKDTMRGGAGNDTYVVDDAADVVVENSNSGTDTVRSTVSLTLGANIERLELTGTAAINGTGNGLANFVVGNSGANTLNGGSGADTLVGGAGNDAYTVDNTGDVVTELAGEGTDTVSSSVTYTLAAHVENLTLTGSSAIHATGNALDNVLTGNSAANTLTGDAGNDTLNGGSGNDTMRGGAGNDTYVVNVSTDVVTELANEGIDTVQSGVTLTLGNNVENLTLTGTSAINGTGNALDNLLTGNGANNTLTGNAGNDTLDGGAGTDTMRGGAGNDVYVVERSADVVTENANEGTDTVRSSVTWTLGSNVENLTLTGAAAINGTGNTLNNTLFGNGAANTLAGAAGNDSYAGGAGNDTLSDTSTTSNDIYAWGRGEGADALMDAGGTDRLDILAGAVEDQIWLRRVGNHLELSVIGTGDAFTVSNWYAGTASRVESFRLSDGQALQASQVQQLVDAMAAFAPPAAGQTSLPPNYQQQLGVTIAASWV
jgi:Ca2+-binding RTX toxin-like protein